MAGDYPHTWQNREKAPRQPCDGGSGHGAFLADGVSLLCLRATMNGFAGFAPSPSSPAREPAEPTPSQAPLPEDVDMSGGSSGTEAMENGSTGRDSQGSDCDDSGKELRMLVEPPDARGR